MADLQSKIEAHQEDVKRAKEQIDETTQKADSYLINLTKNVEKYEKKHADFEPAGKYLKSALDASRAATQKLKTHGQDLSERSVPVAIDGMQGVRESLDDLQKRAVEYDDKYAKSRGQATMDTLHHWVNSGRQHATDALEIANDQLMKLRDAIGNMADQAMLGAQPVVGEVVRVAELGDEELGVSSKAGGVVQKMRDLDARLCVSATAAKVDTKVTGGLGCKVASTTVDIVTESVSYISDTLHNAKLAAQQSETAQNLEAQGVALTEAATEKKNELQSTFDESVEKGKEMAGMAAEKTEKKAGQAKDKAGEMKDSTAEKADQAKDKIVEMKDTTAEKAGQAKEAAKDKAGEMKDNAVEMKDKAGEKVGQAKEAAKDKAGMAKDEATDTADQAMGKACDIKEQTKETAGQAMGKSGDVKEQAKEKASEAKGVTKEKASQAKESVKEKTESATDTKGKRKHTSKSSMK